MNMMKDSLEYTYELITPLKTMMGYPILTGSLTPAHLMPLTLTLQNTHGDTYVIHAEKHGEGYVFVHITGRIIGEYLRFEPEYAEPAYERLIETPREVRQVIRRQLSDEPMPVARDPMAKVKASFQDWWGKKGRMNR